MSNAEELRGKLVGHLSKLVGSAEPIHELLADLPHPRGLLHRSLNPGSSEHIIHIGSDIKARFRDSDGTLYDIEIYRREGK